MKNELVFVNDNEVVTDSLVIAEMFRKEHSKVSRDIRTQMDYAGEEFSQSNFGQSDYTNNRGKTYPKYNLTEEAFTLVVMSYNTKEAVQMKIKFIQEFKRMKEHILKGEAKPLRIRKKSVNLVFRQEMDMAKTMSDMVGVDKGIAFSVAIDRASKKTGEDLSSYMKLLPVATHETGFLNPTQIGEQIGKSARAVNTLLEERGLQTKIEKTWRLTDEGKKYAEEIPYTKNGHSGYQLQWHEGIVDLFVGKEAS